MRARRRVFYDDAPVKQRADCSAIRDACPAQRRVNSSPIDWLLNFA
jgi:hypothetical protein